MKIAQKTIRFDRGHGYEDGTRYRYPKIDARFFSPLVNDRNLELSGGCPDTWLVDRVLSGEKPICFIDSEDKQAIVELVDRAMAAGCGAAFQPHVFEEGRRRRDHYFASICVPGAIADVFDLEALIADYYDYLLPFTSLEAVEPIEDEFHRLSAYRFSDFLEFERVEVEWVRGFHGAAVSGDWRRFPHSIARCGLLLGYPVETSVALICGDLGIPGTGSSDLPAQTNARARGVTA